MKRDLIYVVGNTLATEFQAAREWLRRTATVEEIASLDAIAPDVAPQAIVLIQQRPGEFSAAHQAHLLKQYPLAVAVQFLGPLCDGEARTGRLQPGVTRVRWQHWESELPDALGGGSLPRAANEVDRLLNQSRFQMRSLPAGAIGVVAATATAADTVADAVRGCGGTAAIAPSLAPYVLRCFTAVIVDLDGSPSAAGAVQRALTEAGPPLILLSAFLRPEEVAAWRERGAAAVLAKPFPLAQLEHALSAIAEPNHRQEKTSAA